MTFLKPTPCQAACIPKILRGKDVVCAAQTGSGKTLAFALPALHDALANSDGVRSLVLAPTRELARQIAQHCVNALPRSVDAKRLVCCIVGGLAEQKQERRLALAPSIVVATPGRARELIEDGKASTVAKALEERTLRFLILDEADRLLAPGAFADFTLLTKRYLVDHAERPRKRWQTLVFSATLACGSTQPRDKKRKRQTDADPRALLKAVEPLRSPTRKLEVVDLTSRKEEDADEEEEENVALPSTLTLEAVRVVDAAKLATCYALLRGGSSKGKTVVFTNAISSVKTVASALQKLQIPRVVALHAALQQRQRLRALDAFEKHDDAVLVATDVAARGLDVAGVSLVIHYDVAPTMKLFVHRAGRTARAGREGRVCRRGDPRRRVIKLSRRSARRSTRRSTRGRGGGRGPGAAREEIGRRRAPPARDRAGRDWRARGRRRDLVLDDDAVVEVGGLRSGTSTDDRRGRRAAAGGPWLRTHTLRMLAEERERGDGPRPRDKKGT